MKKLYLFLVFIFPFSCIYASPSDTLDLVADLIAKKEKGAYLNLGESDLYSGLSCSLIKKELEDFFLLEIPNVIKSHSISFRVYKNIIQNKRLSSVNFSSPLAPTFFSTSGKEVAIGVCKVLRDNNVLLIGDAKIPLETRNLLFGNSCKFISVPSRVNTQALKLLKEKVVGQLTGEREYTVVVFAFEGMGKLLVENLLTECDNIFVLDLGSLKHSLSNWDTSVWETWLSKNQVPSQQENRIKILYTSALIPSFFEERKKEYVHSLETLESYGYKNQTYVVESTGYSPLSFFDQVCEHVFYANTNDTTLINKGVNEAKAMLAAFDFYQFNDDDMIVKLTGRYCFKDDNFLKLVSAHPEVDAFASFCVNKERGVQTGCFAMRAKYFKQMIKELDFDQMETSLIDIETEVGRFCEKMASEKASVYYVDRVGLMANVANHHIEYW